MGSVENFACLSGNKPNKVKSQCVDFYFTGFVEMEEEIMWPERGESTQAFEGLGEK